MNSSDLSLRRVCESSTSADRAAPLAGGRASATRLRVGLWTLGCDKNTVDSERILAELLAVGAEYTEALEDAELIVVNTCGFIDIAKEESVEALLEAARLKLCGRARLVVGLGCLVERYKNDLAAAMPEADLLLGLREVGRLVPELRARGLLPPTAPSGKAPVIRARAVPERHSSFLKVSEGCDHGCSFCAIPLIRGRQRSLPLELLLREARELEARGVVELNLVSQDTTQYGRDMRGRQPGAAGAERDGYYAGKPRSRVAGAVSLAPGIPPRGSGGRRGRSRAWRQPGRLVELLRALLEATTIPWFRLLYMYPSGIHAELAELIAAEPRILAYLDMPIQHGSDAVLARMGRPERRRMIIEHAEWLRRVIPGLALRTSVMVGFPGETEEDFDALLELLEQVSFDRLGAFRFSPEEGTPAALFPDRVAEAVSRERLERLLEVQAGISAERDEEQIGRVVQVLVDGVRAGGVVGRTAGQAPEVDGEIRLRGGAGLRPGEFVRARVVEARDFDLVGKVVTADE